MIQTTWEWLVANPGPNAIMAVVAAMVAAECHAFAYRDDAGWRGRAARALQARGLTLLVHGGAR